MTGDVEQNPEEPGQSEPGKMPGRIFVTLPSRLPWQIANPSRAKQLWRLVGVVGGIVTGGVILIALVLLVSNVVLADQAQRESERKGATAAKPYEPEVEAQCIHWLTYEELEKCVADKVRAAHDAKHDEADLRAQQDMASFALGIYWWTLLGFITSTLSVVALVGTFLAQQKLNRTQSRAYVELEKAMVRIGTEGKFLRVRFTLLNRGDTPALNVQAFVYTRYYPPCENTGKDAIVFEPRNPTGRPLTGFLNMLPVKKPCSFEAYGQVDFPVDYLTGEKTPEDGFLPAVLRVDCMITFHDAFGKRRRFYLRTGTAQLGEKPVTLAMPNDDQFGISAYVDPRLFPGDEDNGDDDDDWDVKQTPPVKETAKPTKPASPRKPRQPSKRSPPKTPKPDA